MDDSQFFAERNLLESTKLARRPLGNFKYSKLKEKNDNPDESDVYCAIDDDELSPARKFRIPDHVNSTFELLREASKYYGDSKFIGLRKKTTLPDGSVELGDFEFLTYSEAFQLAKVIGTALTKEELVPECLIDNCTVIKNGKFLGIWSLNCPYWLLTDYASTGYGFVTVPIYETLGDDALFKILQTTKLQTVCIDANKIDNLENLLNSLKEAKQKSYIQTVISFDPLTDEEKERLENMGLKYHVMDELVKLYHDSVLEPPPNRRTDVCTVVYTSGTSGTPKGAVFNNEGLMILVERLLNLQNRCNLRMGVGILSFLPMSHVYERFIEHLIPALRGRIGYFSGNIKNLLDDLNLLKPEFMVAVPRVFTRILSKIRSELDSKPFLVRKLVYFFVHRKKKVLRKSPEDPKHWLYDLVLNKIKMKFGGKFDTMVLGSASMTDNDIYDMQAFMCCPLAEGWGTTELGVAFLQDFRDNRKATIGGPLYGIDFKIRSVEELGYSARGTPPRGELMVRGPGIMLGYLCEKELTEEVLDKDGWYKTGDVVELMPNMSVKILDRARNFFKMSQGEYIAPDKLENAYVNCKLVEQVYVHGDPTENNIVGIVVVSKEDVEKWAVVNGLGNRSMAELLANEKLKARIRLDFEKIADAENFNSLERLKVFTLVDKPFSVEDGMLTPTFKSVRYRIKAQYMSVIKQMYDSLKD